MITSIQRFGTEAIVHAHTGAFELGIADSKRIIRDSGHLLYVEKPEEFSRVVIWFIESNID